MAEPPPIASQASHTSLTDDLKLPKVMTAIIGFSEVNVDPDDKHVAYEIKVAVGGVKWTIHKRYSQFLALYEALERQYGSKAGHLPGKTIFTSKTSGAVSTTRQIALNQWLESLLLGELSNALELHTFLEVKGHVLTPPTKFVLIALPDKDFDPTEVAVPWKLLSIDGIGVHFATPNGSVAACDQLTIGAGPSRLPLKLLEAEPEAKAWYREMINSASFVSPLPYAMIAPSKYAAFLLPGGHAPGMKQYLESAVLQAKVVEFSKLNRPIAAICHGVLLLARCKDAETGLSVIGPEKVTTLTASMEKSAYLITAPFHGRLYRTYEVYCEEEVASLLPSASQVQQGPAAGTNKGTLYDDTHAFVVESGKFLTARWPGDAYLFGKRLVKLLA